MNTPHFTYSSAVKLHDTDAAGLLFFSNVFTIAHDAYEAFMESRCVGIGTFIAEKKLMLPVVRSEAEFKKPQSVGDKFAVHMRCEKIGKSSYTTTYEIRNEEGELSSSVRIVNAVLDYKTRSIVPLPGNLRKALESIR